MSLKQAFAQVKSLCPDYDSDVLLATLVDVGGNVGAAVNRVYDGQLSEPRDGLREEYLDETPLTLQSSLPSIGTVPQPQPLPTEPSFPPVVCYEPLTFDECEPPSLSTIPAHRRGVVTSVKETSTLRDNLENLDPLRRKSVDRNVDMGRDVRSEEDVPSTSSHQLLSIDPFNTLPSAPPSTTVHCSISTHHHHPGTNLPSATTHHLIDTPGTYLPSASCNPQQTIDTTTPSYDPFADLVSFPSTTVPKWSEETQDVLSILYPPSSTNVAQLVETNGMMPENDADRLAMIDPPPPVAMPRLAPSESSVTTDNSDIPKLEAFFGGQGPVRSGREEVAQQLQTSDKLDGYRGSAVGNVPKERLDGHGTGRDTLERQDIVPGQQQDTVVYYEPITAEELAAEPRNDVTGRETPILTPSDSPQYSNSVTPEWLPDVVSIPVTPTMSSAVGTPCRSITTPSFLPFRNLGATLEQRRQREQAKEQETRIQPSTSNAVNTHGHVTCHQNTSVTPQNPQIGRCVDSRCEGCSQCGYADEGSYEMEEDEEGEEEREEEEENDQEHRQVFGGCAEEGTSEYSMQTDDTADPYIPILEHSPSCTKCAQMWSMRDRYLLPEGVHLGWRESVVDEDTEEKAEEEDDVISVTPSEPWDDGIRTLVEDDCISLPGDIYKAVYCSLFSLPPHHPGFRPPPTRWELERGLLGDQLIVHNFPRIFEHFYRQKPPKWLPFYAHLFTPYPPTEPYMLATTPRIVLHPAEGELESIMRKRRQTSREREVEEIGSICLLQEEEEEQVEMFETSTARFGNHVHQPLPYTRGYSYDEREDRREREQTVRGMDVELGRHQHHPRISAPPTAKDTVAAASAYSFLRDRKEVEVKRAEKVWTKKEPEETRTESFDVSIVVPNPSFQVHEMVLLKGMVDVLYKCGAVDISVRNLAPVVRAEYEEQSTEIGLTVEMRLKGAKEQPDRIRFRLSLLELARQFCVNTSYGLHEQPSLVMPLKEFCTDHSLVHMGVPIKMLHIGNLINPGLFFVRGEYFSHYNTSSNERDKRQHDASGQTWVAGRFPLLSFMNFEHDRRHATIYFAIRIPTAKDGLCFAGFSMHISYSSITSIQVDTSHPSDNIVFLQLKYPPQLWEGVPRLQPNGCRFLNMDSCREWVRVLSWPGHDKSGGCSQDALGNSPHLAINFSKQEIPLRNTVEQSSGTDRHYPSRQLLEIVSRISRRCNAPVTFAAIKMLRRRQPVTANIPDLGSFRLNYAFHALVTRGCKVTDQLFDLEVKSKEDMEKMPFFVRVRHAYEECPEAAESAMENLLSAVDERRIVHILDAFDHMYQIRFDAVKRAVIAAQRTGKDVHALLKEDREVPKNCVLVRKVMVTPMRVMFMAPEVMMTNRVVRRFGEEYAMRCVFRDDSGFRLQCKDFYKGSQSSLQDQPPIVARLITNSMEHGLTIIDRHYEFLAWSNSQMRDHGCYMYASRYDQVTGQPLFTIDTIRSWMGDFSMCLSVPKMMSRMGQCFTQAQPTIQLRDDEYTVEGDYEGGSGHPETGELYCFSDGVGRIGVKHSIMLTIALDQPYVPSCFQVRFRGFKGVLTVDKTLDRQKGPKIVFRESQQKFQDTNEANNVLEVVKYAMFSPVCLNRPLITVIDHVAHKQGEEVHGRVSRRIHYYLEKELTTLTKMLLDEREAAEGLTSRCSVQINFRRMLQCGFTMTDEPFFRRMLVAVYKHNITQHLSKAKIFLPSHLGRSMYGVFDDSGLLQHGQVFIQYSTFRARDRTPGMREPPPMRTKVHLGKVLVSKNPCRVAGDCRVFDAVFQPALAHLVDVIVFPRYGARPHPDEMAGSDLDGDEYCVIFDRECMFDSNEEAMVFPKTKAEQFDEAPTTNDMVAFFLRYLNQDSIGRLSNAHLQASDFHGLFNDICDSIARKCAVAVDFPKTGVPAEQLTPFEQLDCVPDYMAHNTKPMFRSKWLNGELYRKVKKVEDILELTENTPSLFDGSIDRLIVPESSDPFEGDDALFERILRLKNEYTAKIQSLLDEYGISDEAQIVSGHITSLKRLTAMERDDYSFYHTDKIVELRYANIFNYYRKEFFKEFGREEDFLYDSGGGTMEMRSDGEMEKRAVQWYSVAYDSDERTFLSFPWIVWDVLACAKRNILLNRNLLISNISSRSSVCTLLSSQTRELRELDTGFGQMVDTMEVVKRYSAGYGASVLDMVYMLHRWTVQPELRRLSPIRLTHMVSLLFQYCHGIVHGDSQPINDMPVIVFPVKIAFGTVPDDLIREVENPGEIVVHFLRYLGTHSFQRVELLNLDMDDGNPEPIVLRSEEYWVPVSQLAYKTLHHLAVSGRFESLGLGAKMVRWSSAESKTPTIVSQTLFEGLELGKICTTLAEWSGADTVSGRNTQHKWFVSCVGSVAARQRLARLLLMNPLDLREAIREGKVPMDVLDDAEL